MKKLLHLSMLLLCCLLYVNYSHGQCLQMINNPSDTMGWLHGSSRPSHPGHYNNDTFVICNSQNSENNYLYNSYPATINGTASTFSMSFDFRIDSNHSCSDGLTFWFFTSGLSQLGSVSKEGGSMGFPDTTSGFALSFRTIGCVDEIYMKKINSTSFNAHWSTGNFPGDTNICSRLTSQMFLTDSQWHHCIVNYDHGNITTSFDGGRVTMSGYSPIYGTGHFGFMGTNGGGYSRKCLKNIQLCAGLGTPTFASDSFGTYINRLCNGPQITVQTNTYSSAYHVKTYYGDGTSDSAVILPAMTGGYAILAHNYSAPGSYTIRQKLFNGTALIDSLTLAYENIFCVTLPVKLYYDVNNNCLPEASEPNISQPVVVEIDSNSIPIDTICSTSGFYYNARGTIGDVYSFKVLSAPGNMAVSCPSTGILYDSLTSGVFIYPIKYFGLNCASGTAFDLSVHAVIPVTGVHDQWANVYVQNSYCAPTNGTLTLHYSPKYMGTPTQITPSATSVSGNTIVWDLSSLSSTDAAPVRIHYEAEHGSTPLTIRDTVHSYFSLSPMAGDTDTTNNTIFRNDTVKAGCDPNEIWVSPADCIASGVVPTLLQYTINFENTGNDTAYNIYVMDTLSDNLDVSTMNIIMSTHEMYLSKLKDAAGHIILKFDFPHINLLDSSHHGACDGGLIYSIKSKPGLANGTQIKGRAGIYFDVNGVVLTNQVINEIGCPVVNMVGSTSIDNTPEVYPNPATDELNIHTTAGRNVQYSITNSIGTTLMSGTLKDADTKLNIKALAAGMYYIKISGDTGVVVKKFVKR
ncbi:MAG: T9SS type A sorting domain-containing protein [Taibaiella sp.]|nr:T9SS type A sorting domain-containing protein [Taibaiella sp.]